MATAIKISPKTAAKPTRMLGILAMFYFKKSLMPRRTITAERCIQKPMKTCVSAVLALTLFAISFASASDPGDPADAKPESSQSGGTIVFYRPKGLFGAGMRPDILLDGQVVGQSAPGKKFHVAVPSGPHRVSVPNSLYSGERALEISIVDGEMVYVRTSLGGSAFGGRTNVELIDAATGANETEKLKLVSP